MNTNAITTKIVNYLRQHGRMSLNDICQDLDVTEFDIDAATCLFDDRARIVGCRPIGWGSGAWYRVVE